MGHSRPHWCVLSTPHAPARGRLKVHQGIGSRYAGERTRGTVMARRGRLRRATNRLLPVAGRRRPPGTDPADRGRDGGRLPHADRPADPAPGPGPASFLLPPLGAPPGDVPASVHPPPEDGPRPP